MLWSSSVPAGWDWLWHGAWPPGGLPKLNLAIPGTVVLMLGSVTMWWGEKGIRAGRQLQLLIGLGASVLLGLAFVVL